MECEEALSEELNISIDPIRNGIMDEDMELMDELEVANDADGIPIEYIPMSRKDKLITDFEEPMYQEENDGDVEIILEPLMNGQLLYNKRVSKKNGFKRH